MPYNDAILKSNFPPQVVKEQTYKKWLKALAVEVIRQTPLNTLKFMDILFIAELLEKRQDRRVKPSRLCFPKIQRTDDARALPNRQIYNSESDYSSNVRSPAGPLNDSSHDFSVSENDSLHCDSFDTHKSYCADSGYCSLQSAYGKSELSETELENHIKKPFEELCEKFERQDLKVKSKIRKSNVSCFNLLNKFKRSNSKENSADVNDEIGQSPTSKYICAMSPNGSESPSEDSILFDSSNDKENRVPDFSHDNQLQLLEPVKVSCKLIDNYFSEIHSKIEYYQNFQPQPEQYVISDGKFHSTENTRKEKSVSQSDITRSPSRTLERRKTRENLHVNSIPDVLKDLPDTFPRTKRKPSVSFQLPEEMLQNENANVLVRLLTKCQIDKEYVPVREKRILFESLSRFSFSVDNLKKRVKPETCAGESFVKYRSLFDLNKSHVQVSAMKKYFESFSEKDEK